MLSRVLVIDESLNPRLAKELRNRGRQSRPVQDLGLKGMADAELIQKVFALYDDPVLVTADDSMPAEHDSVLASVNGTVATVRPGPTQCTHSGEALCAATAFQRTQSGGDLGGV